MERDEQKIRRGEEIMNGSDGAANKIGRCRLLLLYCTFENIRRVS